MKYNKGSMISILKFILVGCSNAIVSLIVYYILIGVGIHYQIANIFGFIIGTLNGYLWSKNWVFNDRTKTKNQIVKFYGVYFITWMLGSFLLFIWIEILHINGVIAPLINIIVTTPLNYIISKLWVFNKKGS